MNPNDLEQSAAEAHPSAPAAPSLEAVHLFDARGVARRFRHAAIFGALEALAPGETMRFVNDHDPLPLLRQMEGHFGETVAVAYRQRSAGGVVIDFTKQDVLA
jgi:uncharacterized protein (DUF2249 family)